MLINLKIKNCYAIHLKFLTRQAGGSGLELNPPDGKFTRPWCVAGGNYNHDDKDDLNKNNKQSVHLSVNFTRDNEEKSVSELSSDRHIPLPKSQKVWKRKLQQSYQREESDPFLCMLTVILKNTDKKLNQGG